MAENNDKLYPRKILPEIAKYLDDPGIILLVGARQVGKTSILHLLMDEVRKRGRAEKTVHYFDLEDFALLDVFNAGVKEFIAYLNATGVDTKKKQFIFVDEIQYMANPANFLKLIADNHKNLKLIVSGSSTLEIRRKFKDSLAGRKVVFEIFPLDFSEFLVFKGEQALSDALVKSDIRHLSKKVEIEQVPARLLKAELARYFQEYLVFGGYPKVALEAEQDRKSVV